jgi:hypothetical protein
MIIVAVFGARHLGAVCARRPRVAVAGAVEALAAVAAAVQTPFHVAPGPRPGLGAVAHAVQALTVPGAVDRVARGGRERLLLVQIEPSLGGGGDGGSSGGGRGRIGRQRDLLLHRGGGIAADSSWYDRRARAEQGARAAGAGRSRARESRQEREKKSRHPPSFASIFFSPFD